VITDEVIVTSEHAELSLGVRRGVHVASIRGEVDISNVATLAAPLHTLRNDATGLVVDLELTEFIDSSVVATLFELRERLRRRGQPLRLVAPAAAPMRVLELTGFATEAAIDPSVEIAVERVRQVTDAPS
jgi:anti-anti-sigma factor